VSPYRNLAPLYWNGGKFKHNVPELVMMIIKKIVKNILPYYFVRRIQDYKLKKYVKSLARIDDYVIYNGRCTYSPWLSDDSFNKTYDVVREHTLLGQLKSYVLWQMVREASKLNGAMIEVGVWRGGSGALIAQQAKNSNITDNLYLCDTFSGVVKTGGKDSHYTGGEHADTSKETVENLLEKLVLKNIKILRGIFPDETGSLVEDTVFKFCHLDVDVYQSSKDIIEWIWPKLVIGGMILFDDYGWYLCDGITKLVNEERNKRDRLVINNWNDQAVIVKIA
jgi:O-methyltransferase